MKFRGLVPNSYIHVSVSDWYIPTIGPPLLLQQNRWTEKSWEYINRSQISQISEFGSVSCSMFFMTKTEKFAVEYIFFLICYIFILRRPWRTSNLQDKPSVLQREHPSLQNMKFLSFLVNFCLPGMRFPIRIHRPIHICI